MGKVLGKMLKKLFFQKYYFSKNQLKSYLLKSAKSLNNVTLVSAVVSPNKPAIS